MQTQSSPMSGRWRKRGKRGVSPIIATILLVAITVVLAAVLYILISGLTKGPGGTPIGTALSMSAITESASGANFVYVATVQTGGSGMQWQNMIWQVQGSNGAPVAAGPVNVTVTNPALNSCNSALFTFATGAWTVPTPHCASGVTGGSASVASGAQVTLISTVNLNSASDKLVAIGQGSYSGSESTTIP